jgi:hypothetical protein
MNIDIKKNVCRDDKFGMTYIDIRDITILADFILPFFL